MSTPKNSEAIGYGNKNGEIKYGHIHEDGVISSVCLRSGSEAKHYISLDSSGEPHRANGTLCRSTGSFQVQSGDNTPTGQPGIFFDAINGDIILNAQNGRIRILAENIDLIAEGADGKNGVITIESNEKIIINGKQGVDIRSKTSAKIFSEKTVEVIGNGILNIYGGLIESIDGAASGGISPTTKGSKTCPVPGPGTPTEIRNRVLSIIKDITG